MGNTLTISNAPLYRLEMSDRKLYNYTTSKEITFTSIDIGGSDPDYKLFTELIEGSQSVKITNSKLNISLGKIKNTYLTTPSGGMASLTASPADVKIFMFSSLYTDVISDSNRTGIRQEAHNPSYEYVSYIYSDKDANVTGTVTGEITVNVTWNLKAGWNSVIMGIGSPGYWKTGKPSSRHCWIIDDRDN